MARPLQGNSRIEELNYRAHTTSNARLRCPCLVPVAQKRPRCHRCGANRSGKISMSPAVALRACEEGYSARNFRAPKLLHDVAVAPADGNHPNKVAALNHVGVIVSDDWLVAPVHDSHRRDLLGILDDRYDRRPTMTVTQLPVELWHEVTDVLPSRSMVWIRLSLASTAGCVQRAASE